MRFYLDDDVEELAVARALIAKGFDVIRSTEVGMRGADDEAHLERATAEGRVLISANRRDFSGYTPPGSAQAGAMLVLRWPLSTRRPVSLFVR